MIPYYILLFAPLLFSLYAQHGRITVYNKIATKEQKWVIGLFFVVFIMLVGLRGLACGSDTRNYVYYFSSDSASSLKAITQKDNIEIAFHLFNKLISYLSNNVQVYFFVISLLSIVPIWILYESESELPYLSIILFVTVAPFSLYFSGLRQALAMAFAPLAYYYSKRSKLISFFIVSFFATLFHQSAVMLFLMYPIFRARITRNWLYIVIPVMTVFFVLNSRIYSTVTPLLGERYYERYGTTTPTGAYAIIALLLLFSIFSIVVADEDKLGRSTVGLRNILFLSVCLQCFAPVNAMAMRMNYYYLIFVPLVIPKMITNSKETYKKVTYIATVVMCAFFLLYYIYGMYKSSDIMRLYPYVGFWQN